MSRAFVNEEHYDDSLPSLVRQHPCYLTTSGYLRLSEQLRQYQQDYLRLQQQRDNLEAQRQLPRLRQLRDFWQQRLTSAKVIEVPAQPSQVSFGCWVQCLDQQGHRWQFQLVGEDEADPNHWRISLFSPLGQSLLAKQCGDQLLWQRDGQRLELEVINISNTL
ncbi:GreA/GreB family elongation factor [Balneatrix alpica]|uniref:GreA/GreB family elongation factor n=1 Tax=Balneatrix alpica TaxID=75684 RepID=A0ABV5ZCW2_9GAMM|nr:GreA/GreB family elongation factor [Balneatrix alpica]